MEGQISFHLLQLIAVNFLCQVAVKPFLPPPSYKTLLFCSVPGWTDFNGAQRRLELYQWKRQRGSETEVERRIKQGAPITERVRWEGMSPYRQEEVREVKMRERRDGNEPDRGKGNGVEENEESTFIIISLFPDKPTTSLMTPMRAWMRACRCIISTGKQRCATLPSSGQTVARWRGNCSNMALKV